ncbi:hypothetical protein ACS0TK_27610, partial [Raoultella ornithinolytica]|uniref:hypothetical protein n=1 Tax=Raoultella ornithinolytica TaxID=54291 RepID=UPI003EC902BC
NCPAALRWHGPTRSAHDIPSLAGQAILLSHPQPRIYWLACLACWPHMRFGELPGGASLARAYTIGA